MSGIGGIGTSYYNNLMETLGSASGSADKLKDTLDRISAGSEGSGVKKDEASETEDKELMEACKSFESYFIEQVFKGMQKTVPESQFSSSATSSLVDYYKDNMIQELAKQSTETNSIGLAQTMYEQMKRNYSMNQQEEQ